MYKRKIPWSWIIEKSRQGRPSEASISDWMIESLYDLDRKSTVINSGMSSPVVRVQHAMMKHFVSSSLAGDGVRLELSVKILLD